MWNNSLKISDLRMGPDKKISHDYFKLSHILLYISWKVDFGVFIEIKNQFRADLILLISIVKISQILTIKNDLGNHN